MENHKKVEQLPDWSNMSTEILEQFCKRLTIPNQVRFSSVCKSWLSANTSKKVYHWIPDAPWLVSKDYTNAQFQVMIIDFYRLKLYIDMTRHTPLFYIYLSLQSHYISHIKIYVPKFLPITLSWTSNKNCLIHVH